MKKRMEALDTRRSTRRRRRCIARQRGAARRRAGQPGQPAAARERVERAQRTRQQRRRDRRGSRGGREEIAIRQSLKSDLILDLYVILGLAPGASTPTSSGRTAGWRGGIIPDINPGIATAEAMFQRISRGVRDAERSRSRRQQYDSAGGGVGRRRRPPRSSSPGSISRSRRTARRPRRSPSCSPMCLHPRRSRRRGRPEAAPICTRMLTRLVRRGDDAAPSVRSSVTRQDSCGACRGSGQRADDGRRAVRRAMARGSVRWARGHMVFSKPCATCGGTGRQRSAALRGLLRAAAGCRTEAIACACRRACGRHAAARCRARDMPAATAAEPAICTSPCTSQPHPFFRREGDDLHMRVPVAVHEAVLGARIDVPTLDGPVGLRVPPGTQAGQRFRLARARCAARDGRPRRPDCRGADRAAAAVDERSRELMREFGRAQQRRDLERTGPRTSNLRSVHGEARRQGVLHDQRGGAEIQHPPADAAPVRA